MTTAPDLVPYLAVRDGRRALEWYIDVLGARLRGEPIIMPDGRLGHAELDVGRSVLYLADEFPEINVSAPAPDAGTSVSLALQVADVDAVVERAVRAGATLERPPSDQEYGRAAGIRDPLGHRWLLQSPLGPRLRHGDVAYASVWVPDAERAAAFYADVLGWQYDAGNQQVAGATPRQGLSGDNAVPTLFCCYAVDDLDAAVQRVRDAGGQAAAADDRPYGRLSDCTDPEGQRFALIQNDALGRRPVARRAGDISYLTMGVRDSEAARAFYGAVLGWRFTPGRVPDGWNVEDTAPMTGLWGGAERPAIWPMYQVDDIRAAVERVRARGGTASDITEQPYGLTSECVDDQGTHFYLGQDTRAPAATTHVRHGAGVARPYLYGHPDLFDFVRGVFGAEEVERAPVGRGFHLELKIGDSVLILETNEALPPSARPASVYVYVHDVDAAYRRALELGATSLSAPENKPYGERVAGIQDTFGNTWWIATYRGA